MIIPLLFIPFSTGWCWWHLWFLPHYCQLRESPKYRLLKMLAHINQITQVHPQCALGVFTPVLHSVTCDRIPNRAVDMCLDISFILILNSLPPQLYMLVYRKLLLCHLDFFLRFSTDLISSDNMSSVLSYMTVNLKTSHLKAVFFKTRS